MAKKKNDFTVTVQVNSAGSLVTKSYKIQSESKTYLSKVVLTEVASDDEFEEVRSVTVLEIV